MAGKARKKVVKKKPPADSPGAKVLKALAAATIPRGPTGGWKSARIWGEGLAKACAAVSDYAADTAEVEYLAARQGGEHVLAACNHLCDVGTEFEEDTKRKEAAVGWLEDALDALEAMVFCDAGRAAVLAVPCGESDPLRCLAAATRLGPALCGSVARVVGNISMSRVGAQRLVDLKILPTLLDGFVAGPEDTHASICWALDLLCYHSLMLDTVGRMLETTHRGEALTNLIIAGLEPAVDEDGGGGSDVEEGEEMEEDEESEESSPANSSRKRPHSGGGVEDARDAKRRRRDAAGADAAEAEDEGCSWRDAAGFFDRLILGGHISPVAVMHDASGQGIGAIIEGVERGVYAAKVCLLALTSVEEGLVAARSGLVDVEHAAMALLMLAPHSRLAAETLLTGCGGAFLTTIARGAAGGDVGGSNEEEEEEDDDVFAAPLEEFLSLSDAGAATKADRAAAQKAAQADATLDADAHCNRIRLRRVLKELIAAVPRGAPTWADPATLHLRTEAGYALSSSRKGTEVFRKASAAGFGPVTVTRHGQWVCMRFGEVEQGILYTGSPGCAGYAEGRPIPAVLGYDYIRTMAAACLAYAPAAIKQVGCVGLGSGALPYFIADVCKAARVVTWEVDATVVEAAGVMGLPVPEGAAAAGSGGKKTSEKKDECGGAGFVVEHVDALKAVGALPREAMDVVFLDAYNEVGGIPAHLRDEGFLCSVGRALRAGGVAVANLHNGPPGSADRADALAYIQLLTRLVGRVLIVKLPTQQSNLVAVAGKGWRANTAASMRPEAAANLKRYTGLEFDPAALLEHTYTFGAKPMDADGMPAGLWGAAAAAADGKKKN